MLQAIYGACPNHVDKRGGRGVAKMTITLINSYLVKASTQREGGVKNPQNSVHVVCTCPQRVIMGKGYPIKWRVWEKMTRPSQSICATIEIFAKMHHFCPFCLTPSFLQTFTLKTQCFVDSMTFDAVSEISVSPFFDQIILLISE